MSRGAAAVGVVLGLCLCVGTATQVLSLRRAHREIDGLRERVAQLEARPEEPARFGGAAHAEQAREPARAPTRLPPPSFAPAATAPAVPVDEQAIQRIVDKRVEEKMKNQAEKKGDRKVPLFDLAKELALDPTTQSRVEEIANATKKQIFELAKTPRSDGTSLADDLVSAMLKGDEKGAKQLFGRLFTEKVPGTDTTYVAAVGGLQDKARRGLETTLGPDTYARYRQMNVHPENIETGYDPWAEYVRQRGGK